MKKKAFSKFLNEHHNFIILLIFITIMLVIKSSCFNLPTHWDEGSYIEGAIAIQENNLNPFVEFWSYKPPLIFELTAIVYTLFGYSLAIPRIIIALFAAFALFYTYLVGKHIANSKVGLASAVTLFFSPLFFTQSGLFHAAIPLTCLTLSTVYYFLKNKKWKYVLSGSLLVLVKETALLVILSIGLFTIIKYRLSIKKLIEKHWVALPTIPFILWLIGNKIFLGWFLWSKNGSIFTNPGFKIYALKLIISNTFFMHFKWVLSMFTIILIIYTIFSKEIRNQNLTEFIILTIIISIASVIFFWAPEWGFYAALPRYFTYISPFIMVLGTYSIYILTKNVNTKYLFPIVIILVSILFYSSWHIVDENTIRWFGETNLNYLDLVKNTEDSIQYLNTYYQNTTVYTMFPYYMASKPQNGYKNNLTLKDVNKINDCTPSLILTGNKGAGKTQLNEYIKNCNATKIKTIRTNWVYSEIYKIR